MILEIGVPAIHARVLDLTDRLLAGLRAQAVQVVTPADSREERSAIVSFTAGSADADQSLHTRLVERNIAVALRGGRIRVSPSFYNTNEEIDRLLNALRA
jgi:selenocysteine lyase/cysteine desulfurase